MKLSVQTSALPSFITSITDNLSTPCINARDLHHFLDSKRKFADWIKYRIDQYDFVEGVDYSVHKNVNTTMKGFNEYIDYIVSPHMAKELGMLENNERGKSIRKYFIQCEQNLINYLQVQNNMKEKLLQQPNRVVLKRNTIKDLSYLLGVPEFKLNTVLYDNGYCDDTGFPLALANRHFDCVDDEIRWSLPLITKLLK
jgi:phage anti-repressor protein